MKRLKKFVGKLEMQGELERYNDIIQTQLSQGIVERADEVVKDGREFYIPHEAVVRENAESTQRYALFMMILQEQMQVSPHSTSVSKSALHYRTSFGTC